MTEETDDTILSPDARPGAAGAGDESPTEERDPGADEELERLLGFIRDMRGFDFTGYKRSSLVRRLRKRMGQVGVEDWAGYRDRLESDADEFRSLFNTVLINVTGFFRDATAWDHLQAEVLPALVERAGPDGAIRVWSAGCSSGEEAFSLAIAFAEVMGIEESARRVKIYATDVDEEALREARAGTYSADALKAMSPELRERYFVPVSAGYAFRSDLRRRVIFGRHDLTRDAPISRLDLLVCRHTLMYFNVETQDEILDRLDFCLKEHGLVFLGKAEMLLARSDRFETVSMRHRIFRRLPASGPAQGTTLGRRRGPAPAGHDRAATRRRELLQLFVDAVADPVVGIDADGDVAAFTAEARTVFGITTQDVGRPFHDLELSYRPAELRSVIEQAHRDLRSVRLSGVETRIAGAASRYYDIVVQPLARPDGLTLGTAVAFVDVTAQTLLQRELDKLRGELDTAYEELQSTNEELETTNEELQSSIEELESTNEELQSSNEELETSNEELQSTNEELETMNEEMRSSSGTLDASREFLSNVLSSLGPGVVVVDDRLSVQSWSCGAEDLWGLREEEVRGHRLVDLEFGLALDEVASLVEECLRTRRRTGPVVRVAVDRRGRSFDCRISCAPLAGAEGGAVLTTEPWTDLGRAPAVID